ncbi:MAG TPA: lytic transglycosylase domain-containing protein [Phaeodactylibacter sp.]|nr:lytic transglycosylase domain-containing protein [Phaeodactylibacter sp.]
MYSKKSISLYTLALAAFFFVAVFSSYTKGLTEGAASAKKESSPQLPQKVKAINLNRPFDFAGEPLPMDNFDVRERLDQQLLRNAYYHSSTLMNIKRARRFFHEIEKILIEEGVPSDLKYLAVAESSLTNAVSPKGAKGFWQFLSGTAREYGLEVSKEVDERYHLEKATRAACKYLKDKKEKFGSWTLAAAAYNMGSRALAKAINAQKMKSYYDLNLNKETNAYVFRIVALKELMMHPEDFGFYLEEEDKYPPLQFVHVHVDRSINNLGDFACKYGISYRMLKVYNPWLISSKLTVGKEKSYLIKIPKKGKLTTKNTKGTKNPPAVGRPCQ